MNAIEIRQKIDEQIEIRLNELVDKFDYSVRTIQLFAVIIESYFSMNELIYATNALVGLEIICERLKQRRPTPKKDASLSDYIITLEYAQNYYVLRDYIYYSFANEDSVCWEKKGKVSIKLNDKSIFSQHMQGWGLFFMNSLEGEDESFFDMEDILSILRDEDEEEVCYKNKNINRFICNEVKRKMECYMQGIPKGKNLSFGKYSLGDFLEVYECLLGTAIYRRYYSFANNLPSVVITTREEYVQNFEQYDEDKISAILLDIAKSSKSTFYYFEEEDIFVMSMTAFSLRNGVNDLLKYHAQVNSKLFSTEISGPLGDELVEEMKRVFMQYENFRCKIDIKLNKFNESLPDIDLLAISYEPSLGFHIYISEIKNVLQADWAKEFLKGVDKNGYLTKAMSQIEKIKDFLGSEEGGEFIVATILEMFSDIDIKCLFPDGLAILMEFLIITSQNMGVLIGEKNTYVIAAPMLKTFVNNSDGDVIYLQKCIREYEEFLAGCYDTKVKTIYLGKQKVDFEVPSIKSLFRYSPNKYISDGRYKEIEKNSVQTGYSYAKELKFKVDKGGSDSGPC